MYCLIYQYYIFPEKKVIHVLQSQGQAACLIADLQKKFIYKSTTFLSSDSGIKEILQKKVTRKNISKMTRETAG